jgi:hypothetical protein
VCFVYFVVAIAVDKFPPPVYFGAVERSALLRAVPQESPDRAPMFEVSDRARI